MLPNHPVCHRYVWPVIQRPHTLLALRQCQSQRIQSRCCWSAQGELYLHRNEGVPLSSDFFVSYARSHLQLATWCVAERPPLGLPIVPRPPVVSRFTYPPAVRRRDAYAGRRAIHPRGQTSRRRPPRQAHWCHDATILAETQFRSLSPRCQGSIRARPSQWPWTLVEDQHVRPPTRMIKMTGQGVGFKWVFKGEGCPSKPPRSGVARVSPISMRHMGQ